MRENLKWIILGGSIIIATSIYVLGTRYQIVVKQQPFGGSITVTFDRFTGEQK